MICKFKLSHLSIFIMFAMVVMLVALSFELFKINEASKAPELEYEVVTLENRWNADNDSFVKSVIEEILKIERRGCRVIHLIIDDEGGAMTKAYIYYLAKPVGVKPEKKPEIKDDGVTKSFG